MTRKQKRLTIVVVGLLLLGAAAALVLTALKDNLVYFRSPSDILAESISGNRNVRLGGLVEEGSVMRQSDGVTVLFAVTDLSNSVPVRYEGILPDLFREGQGVITRGSMGPDGVFVADEVLAKHDETYMPPEVAEALKKSGEWRGDDAAAKGD
ncbi:MAG TPA: cytochrome c maturation protein CcmE [Kiloniellaceae bacterium]|nr:cytochrome c maturation protein CcmE [Kiloniellaceae bacterium]